MNTAQTAKMTNIPIHILVRMRARETTSLKSGPPFCKKLSADGEVIYEYSRVDVQNWLQMQLCLITATDAAVIIGTSRDEVMKMSGLHSMELKTKDYRGKLIIDNSKHIYIWVPVRKRK